MRKKTIRTVVLIMIGSLIVLTLASAIGAFL